MIAALHTCQPVLKMSVLFLKLFISCGGLSTRVTVVENYSLNYFFFLFSYKLYQFTIESFMLSVVDFHSIFVLPTCLVASKVSAKEKQWIRTQITDLHPSSFCTRIHYFKRRLMSFTMTFIHFSQWKFMWTMKPS